MQTWAWAVPLCTLPWSGALPQGLLLAATGCELGPRAMSERAARLVGVRAWVSHTVLLCLLHDMPRPLSLSSLSVALPSRLPSAPLLYSFTISSCLS